jgi:regulator of sigma E protease
LFQGEVSPKNVGGFFSIGAMAKKSWQIGAPQFLHVMAIISINLFVLNLLPVPVLDGGHLVFYTIEAIKGAPLSMRKMEIAQQVGLVLLLGLMVFALFNDATRMFFN